MTRQHDVPALVPHAVLRYVARALGEAAAEQIRVESGETRTMSEPADQKASDLDGHDVGDRRRGWRLTGWPGGGRSAR